MCLQAIKLKDGRIVPCGKCPQCLARKGSEWSFRLRYHEKSVMSSMCVTLTYNVKNVPLSECCHYMTLNKSHVPAFIKRLRSAHVRAGKYDVENPIKYFAVGEYGSKFGRPHYHVILFNVDRSVLLDKGSDKVIKFCGWDRKRVAVSPSWEFGHVTVDKLSAAAIGYCLKYMLKAGKIPVHRNDDRQREFRVMSKLLGANYLSENMVRWHKDDLDKRMYVPIEDGKKISMPRYFKDKIYTDKERERLKEVYAAVMIEKYIEHVKLFDDPVEHMRYVKEACKSEFRKMAAGERQRKDC